jgi:hypothetical protein
MSYTFLFHVAQCALITGIAFALARFGGHQVTPPGAQMHYFAGGSFAEPLA